MAIVGNVASEIGDIIRIQTDVPVIGIVSLQSFVDDVLGETGARYFDKSFRYSIDGGLNFTLWEELTTINIQNIVVSRKDQFIIDYRYVRTGEEPSGDLSFNNLTLSGDFQELPYPVYVRNLFNLFFDVNDIVVLGWAINVLEKLYNKGIVPDYITRKWDEINPILFDNDFTAFFNSITHFFAIIVYYARQYQDISTNSVLLPKFIDGLGLFVNNNPTEVHLKYLFDNYLDEFKKRGTQDVATIRNSQTIPNGELIRFINHIDPEEFILALLEPHTTGWCLGKSSPSYNYTSHCVNMVKGYEKIEGFEDTTKYPSIPDISFLDILTSPSRLLILPGFADMIVGVYSETLDTSKTIKVNTSLNYEFLIKITQSGINNELNFGIKCFDDLGASVGAYNLKDKVSSDFFFNDAKLPRNNKEYMIRGIIFNKDTDENIQDGFDMTLNIGFGGHLKFTPTVKYIMPFFYTYNLTNPGSVITFTEFRIRPLSFNFTLGKLGIKNILYMLYGNNSLFTQQIIYNSVRDKLIPYDTELIDNNFNPVVIDRDLALNGLLYNGFAVSAPNFAPTGWRIPTLADYNTLFAYLVANQGGKMKSTSIDYWNPPNSGADNTTGFSGYGSGQRDGSGAFITFKETAVFWLSTESFRRTMGLRYNNGLLSLVTVPNNGAQLIPGRSVRLIKEDPNEEPILDYDDNFYETIKIGTQVWTKQNWRCTHLNDGTPIVNVEDDVVWAAASIGDLFCCAYGNDPLNV